MRPRIPDLLAPLRIAALTLSLALSGACDRGPVRVLLIGDSITRGSVSGPSGQPFAKLLPALLGPRFQVLSAACAGASVADWIADAPAYQCDKLAEPDPPAAGTHPNLYADLIEPALPVDVAVILLGTNDAFGRKRKRLSPDGYEAALRSIATSLLARGVGRVILMAPPGVQHRAAVSLRLWRQGQRVARICESVDGVECGPDLLQLLGGQDFAAENVHPNGAGHAKIARALADDILELERGG